MWKATNDQDRELVEKAQRGVTDPSYEPGPYALVEDDVESFINWYVRRLHDYLDAAPRARRAAQPPPRGREPVAIT